MFTSLVACVLLVSSPVPQEEGARVRPWEHETSDVPVDPRIRFGHLENGMRWAWAANQEPKERLYVRMHVNAGSLHETDDERGMAHFLEHMAFNGSESFPPGTLIEWFQERGMSFGPDTNATTGFGETIYMLDLPNADAGSLREGLKVMRDYASGLLLAKEEVDRERGVIDGEERERDTVGYRVGVRQMEIMLAGTRYPERLAIGDKESRDAFTPQALRAFYRRWYRPDNVTLILVGDLGELDPVPLVEEAFGEWTAPDEPLPPEPDEGEPEAYSFAFFLPEEEIPTAQIKIARLVPWEEKAYTKATMVEDLPLEYARRIVRLRMLELTKEEDCPFLGARPTSGEFLRAFDGEELIVICEPELWREALGAAEKELRRALLYGFQEAELEELRADALRALDEAVEREPTQHSRSLVSAILNAAEHRRVPADAATRRAIRGPAIEALTVEACHEALVEAWGEGELTVHGTGNLDLGPDTAQELRAAWEASAAVEIEKGEEIVEQAFAYASDPETKGEVAAREHVADLDVHLLRFANGVTLNVKSTDFKEKQVLVSLYLGEGRLTAEVEKAALVFVADRIFTAGGLRAHDTEEIRRLTAGRQVGVRFGVATDAFALSGATTAEDLLLECELVCAFLTDPGWRDEGLVQLRRLLPQMFESFEHQHQGPYLMEYLPTLYSNDPRVGIPERADLEAVEMDAVREWLTPHLGDAPIEVTIVGDVDVEAAVAAAAATFGTLPERRGLRRYEERRVMPESLTGVRQEHSVDTADSKSLVMLTWPTTDGLDPDVRHGLSFLSSVLSDRLRKEVRENLGASYSPVAMSEVSTTYPGNGVIIAQAMAEPADAEKMVDACLAVVDGVATGGVEAKEVERLVEPVLAGVRDALRTNRFWLQVLGEAHRRPGSLEEIRSLQPFYESMTAEFLTDLAARYLKADRASVLVVNPQTAD